MQIDQRRWDALLVGLFGGRISAGWLRVGERVESHFLDIGKYRIRQAVENLVLGIKNRLLK